MDTLLADMPLSLMLASVAIVFFAGFVKGAVGFAMPMIMISGLSSILPAETALAVLILPTVVTNQFQAFRQGWRAALHVVIKMRIYLVMMLVFLVSSAQLVNIVPQWVLLLLIGAPIVLFAITQLVGLRLHLTPETKTRDELVIGGVSGFIGGMSGVWGPPLIAYLIATDTEKTEAVRVQGVAFGLGGLALLAAHLRSGVLNEATLPLSAAALIPALAGMGVGVLLHDRMPQSTFRRAMLVVLFLAGLNLIRRSDGIKKAPALGRGFHYHCNLTLRARWLSRRYRHRARIA
ncbi:MAG: sulfite exporter TauE/SafE family protein [Maritimibacter sp.]